MRLWQKFVQISFRFIDLTQQLILSAWKNLLYFTLQSRVYSLRHQPFVFFLSVIFVFIRKFLCSFVKIPKLPSHWVHAASQLLLSPNQIFPCLSNEHDSPFVLPHHVVLAWGDSSSTQHTIRSHNLFFSIFVPQIRSLLGVFFATTVSFQWSFACNNIHMCLSHSTQISSFLAPHSSLVPPLWSLMHFEGFISLFILPISWDNMLCAFVMLYSHIISLCARLSRHPMHFPSWVGKLLAEENFQVVQRSRCGGLLVYISPQECYETHVI